MKKTVSIIAAAAMICAAASSAFAANTESGNPDVIVNGSKIVFSDQAAVIVDGRTLVPARGVFEAMGMDVEWDEEKRQVEIESADKNTIIRLVIDDADMKTYDMTGLFATLLSGQDFKAPETVVTLDVEPQIINDRTMVPLRAVSEATKADVKWDEDAYTVNITTANAPTAEEKAEMPTYTLSTSAETVNEGETVDVFVNVSNLPADYGVSIVTATVEYNKENFSLENAVLVNGDTEIDAIVGGNNPDYKGNSVKTALITVDTDVMAKADGKVLKLTFKSLNGKEGSFTLLNTYDTTLGYDTSLILRGLNDDSNSSTYEGDSLNVDATPVTVNAGK